MLDELRHSLAKPVVKKEPVTMETLEAMARDAEESGTLRLTTACWDFQSFFVPVSW